MYSIEEIRAEINAADKSIREAFLQRMAASTEMARTKAALGKETYDPAREKELLLRLSSGERGQEIRELYQTILRQSRRNQRNVLCSLKEKEELVPACRGAVGSDLTDSLLPKVYGLLGAHDFALFEKDESSAETLLRTEAVKELQVCTPYQQTALKLCRSVSPAAAEIGACSLLRREADGSLSGFNTECLGFAYLLKKFAMPLRDRKVIVLGDRGAAGAIRYILKCCGAVPVFVPENADGSLPGLAEHSDAVLLINTTQTGSYPFEGECPADLEELPGLKGVIDLICRPYRTRLLLNAEKKGLACMNGLPMLAAQAAASLNIWRGGAEKLPAASEVEPALKLLEDNLLNLVLVGMPGAGKTTQARFLQFALGRTMFDSDQAFKYAHMTEAEDYISRFGEKAFREEETAVVRELGRMTGIILATGGGTVLREENRDALRQNGHIVFLSRRLEHLSTLGRPMSADKRMLAQIETERLPIYRRLCDIEIPVEEGRRQTAEKIIRVLGLEHQLQKGYYLSENTNE